MNRELLEALRLVQGRGKMSAKDKYGWHPPLSDDGDAMPNSPRDIRSLEDEPDSPLKGTTGADFGQDQFGTPSPNQEKMAKAVGALRLPPVAAPEQPTMKDLMSLKMPSEDFDPGASEYAKQNAHDKGAAMLVSVDPSSYFGGKKPKPMGSGYPMTMAKSDRAAFRGPTSDTAFEIGGEDDPSEGREPWANVPAASFKSLAGVPMGDDEPDLGAAQPELSRGPAGPQPESSELVADESNPLEGFPEEIPTEDLTDEIDIDTGSNSGQAAAPEQSELQRYIAEMNSGEGQASDRRDSDFLNAQQKMNSDMGLYKLLFASANKIGSHAGQQSSDEPFNSFADGAIKSNDKRSELLVKDRAQNKQRQDDKLKALMFMDKQRQDKEKYQDDLTFRGKQLDQLATDKEEGRKVQRESNELMAWYKNAMLEGQMGIAKSKAEFDATKLAWEKEHGNDEIGLRHKKIDADIAVAGSDQGHKANTLAEQSRHNKAMEKNAADKAKQEAKEKAHKARGVSQGAADLDMYRKRMESAALAHDKLTASGYDPTGTKDAILGSIPFAGNALVSKDKQLARQYEIEFYRTKLRKESGASIGDNEAYEEAAQYFPRWGDSKEKVARKKQIRMEVIQGMKDSYKAQVGEAQALSPDPISTLPPPPPGKVRVKDPDTGKPLLIDEADLQEALNDGAEQM